MLFTTEFQIDNPRYWIVTVLCIAIAVNSALTLPEK